MTRSKIRPTYNFMMNKDKSPSTALLSLAAITGNILFAFWILFNGINEGFKGTIIEKFSYITLMGLLAVNAILLIRNRSQQSRID